MKKAILYILFGVFFICTIVGFNYTWPYLIEFNKGFFWKRFAFTFVSLLLTIYTGYKILYWEN